eukprot:scaffold277714_cov30-Tisochrysis_lutea.AAC.3
MHTPQRVRLTLPPGPAARRGPTSRAGRGAFAGAGRGRTEFACEDWALGTPKGGAVRFAGGIEGGTTSGGRFLAAIMAFCVTCCVTIAASRSQSRNAPNVSLDC